MTESAEENVEALLDQIANHQWTRAFNDWRSLVRVYRAFQMNAAELLAVLTDPSRNPEVALRIFEDNPRNAIRENFINEVFRLLHNFCAAAKTLVDHTRILVDRYRKTQFKAEYERRKVEMISADVVAFVQRLRNYLLHARFPPLELNLHLSNEDSGQQFTVLLDRDRLLEWDDWTKGARSYIQNTNPLSIQVAVEEYAGIVESIYDWLFDQFWPLHEAEMVEVDAIRHKARTILNWDDETNRPRPS